jgi:Type IV secretion system proteins
MRKTLLAASLLAGCLMAQPSRAQIAVQDQANLVQQAKDYLQILKSYALQAQQYAAQAQQLETEITQLESFIQNPNLGAAMGLMQTAGLTSAIPINPYAVQSIVSGSGGVQGTFGALSGLMNGSFATNNVYTCNDGSWACAQARAVAAGNAGQQGLAMNSIATMAQHLPVLQGLRDDLATAQDPAQREHIMAELQAETAWGIQENSRLMATNILLTSQQNVRDEQAKEKLNQDLDATIARYDAATR